MKEMLDSRSIRCTENATKIELFEVIELTNPHSRHLLSTVLWYDVDMLLLYGCLPTIRSIAQW
jgi:hypothetical protein